MFLANLVPFLRLARHANAIPRLPETPSPSAATNWPRVSIIVPARNEEQGVRAAVESLLRQDYPALELVVVNDRSTDRTGAILSALAEETASTDRTGAILSALAESIQGACAS